MLVMVWAGSWTKSSSSAGIWSTLTRALRFSRYIAAQRVPLAYGVLGLCRLPTENKHKTDENKRQNNIKQHHKRACSLADISTVQFAIINDQ